MTGHQDNPGTGFTAKGEPTTLISIESLVKAIGIKHVYVIDPNNLALVDETLDKWPGSGRALCDYHEMAPAY